MIERYGESIAGYVERDFKFLPVSNLETIIDFEVEADHHRDKIPASTDHNFSFTITQIDLSYNIPSGLMIAPLPEVLTTMSSVERRAAMVEYERRYNYDTGYAAKLEIYTGEQDTPAAVTNLYTLGHETYLPLSVPYLSEGTAINVDDRYRLTVKIHFPGSANSCRLAFRTYYTGVMNFTLDMGSKSLVFP